MSDKLKKVQLVSDLHLETHADRGKTFADILPRLADVLVIAGDITNAPFFLSGIENFAKKWKHVVFVLGNHDYWFVDAKQEVDDAIHRACDRFPNIHRLENSSVTIDGQRFLGATQWFPMHPLAESLAPNFSDFNVIPWLKKQVNHEFTVTKNYLLANVTSDDIVVTHHLPSYICVVSKYTGDPYNCFFAADMHDVIENNKPKLWFHGHTHEVVDRKVHETRIVCNPFGTLYLPCPDFNDRKVIDV